MKARTPRTRKTKPLPAPNTGLDLLSADFALRCAISDLICKHDWETKDDGGINPDDLAEQIVALVREGRR